MVVCSKIVFFIWGLVFSHALVKKAVVDVLIDFLEFRGLNVWVATLLTTLQELISAVFKVGLTHVSQAYTNSFSVIIFCTGAYAMGLMMLYLASDLSLLIFAMVLTALGTAGQEPTLKDYFDYQLGEEVKKKYGTDDNRSRRSNNHWWPTASFAGSVAAFLGLGETDWWTTLHISSSIMAATHLLFFLGIWCYHPEDEISSVSPLTTISKVIKAAINKRRLTCPCSQEGYYSNISNNQGSNVSEDLFYQIESEEVHLLPRNPSCLMFLDKAAIIGNGNCDAVEREETNNAEVICTVEEVREVKSLYPIIPFGYALFGYSLISAAGNTYFVQQASNLDPSVGDFHVSVVAFFVLKSLVAFVVRTIQSMKKLVKPSRSIAVGMFCSVLCGIAAWLVERRRLPLTLREQGKGVISLSIMSLAPQFLLLGLMEAFAEDGLESLMRPRVPESMREFVEPCIELLLAIEKSFSLVFAFCFGVLTNKSVETSLMDWYFLFLASLSFGFFCIHVCNSLLAPPYEEQVQTDEEGSNN